MNNMSYEEKLTFYVILILQIINMYLNKQLNQYSFAGMILGFLILNSPHWTVLCRYIGEAFIKLSQIYD